MTDVVETTKKGRKPKDFLDMAAPYLGDSQVKETISTQSYVLNDLFSGRPNGGIPRGLISKFTGLASSGKSTIAQAVVGTVCLSGGKAVYIDAECSLDQGWGSYFGAQYTKDPKEFEDGGMALHVTSAGKNELFLEEAIRIILAAIEDGVDLIVIDSVADLMTLQQVESDPEDVNWAAEARTWARNLPTMKSRALMNNVAILAINQLRHNMQFGGYREPGGERWIHAPVLNARFRVDNQAGTANGQCIEVTNYKNKIGGPWKGSDKFYIIEPGGKGIPLNVTMDVLLSGRKNLFTTKTGKPYGNNGAMFFTDEKGEIHELGSSIKAASQFLVEHPDVTMSIMEQLDNFEDRSSNGTLEVE